MIDEIAVIGYPSLCGGADTELLDQIKVWNLMKIKVHLIPTRDNKDERLNLDGFNVEIHDYMDFKSCKNLHTFSFCNPGFLDNIKNIKKYAKSTSWANCMTFNFKTELEAHKNGYIDYFLYQTKHQYHNLAGNLLNVNKNYIPYQFIPYFDSTRFPFIEDRDYSILKYGRISRCDPAKYSLDQFKIYSKCRSKKEGIVLGWKKDLIKECNFDEQDIEMSNCKLLHEGEITQQEFYNSCNVICMSTRTFENLPRIGFEAMSSGCLLIVDDRGGWKLEVDNQVTGYLCKNRNDFINCMNYVSSNKDSIIQCIKRSRKKLDTEFSLEKSASSWGRFFSGIERRN